MHQIGSQTGETFCREDICTCTRVNTWVGAVGQEPGSVAHLLVNTSRNYFHIYFQVCL